MGQRMEKAGTGIRKSNLGYVSDITYYQAINCKGCPMRGQCHKSKENRRIEVNHQLNKYKRKAKELLMSQEGLHHRSKRPIEPEAVFGQIKHNNKFNRFTLRGLEKVEVEFSLVAISHNLRKIAQIMTINRGKSALFSIFIEFKNQKLKLAFDIFNFDPILFKNQIAA